MTKILTYRNIKAVSPEIQQDIRGLKTEKGDVIRNEKNKEGSSGNIPYNSSYDTMGVHAETGVVFLLVQSTRSDIAYSGSILGIRICFCWNIYFNESISKAIGLRRSAKARALRIFLPQP
ncbi:MAG: hypothetical protein KGJ89_04030 [Patescibacteria group bacterium]|nr:hypothetical protein [Patescibacteria group bacterium]MDE2015295.1 hypothetical protein [Patescibacteria group bacterium]MDE2227100.1 hypothetical protein [Patescibacteria group bacterium]